MKSGILPINKPEGLSSAAIVAGVKKVLKAKKVGHTGTLDPFATGVLLCAVNQGTRISQYFLGGHKRYTATLLLGVETDTYDRTGTIVSDAGLDRVKSIEEKTICQVVAGFQGTQEQVPPAFSALKHEGQPLYKLARQGKMVQKPARTIEIFDIRLVRFDLPRIEIEVHCSSGTYIRTIAHDIGRILGCGAHLTELCRTQSSQFAITHTLDWEAFLKTDRESIAQQIVPMSEALCFLPAIVADGPALKKIGYGQKLDLCDLEVKGDTMAPGQTVRVVDNQDQLRALVVYNHSKQMYDYSCVFSS